MSYSSSYTSSYRLTGVMRAEIDPMIELILFLTLKEYYLFHDLPRGAQRFT